MRELSAHAATLAGIHGGNAEARQRSYAQVKARSVHIATN